MTYLAFYVLNSLKRLFSPKKIAHFLGHKDQKNTLIYVHPEKACYPYGGDDYIAKVAKTEAEKLSLIEAGFDIVSADPNGTNYFRKRR
jgi:hypothetical protein